MRSQIFAIGRQRGWAAALFARAAILAMVVIFGTLLAGHGAASAASCDAVAGKALYNCLADKLDNVAAMSSRSPETQTALQKAASQLRVAVNKVQALSAISQAGRCWLESSSGPSRAATTTRAFLKSLACFHTRRG